MTEHTAPSTLDEAVAAFQTYCQRTDELLTRISSKLEKVSGDVAALQPDEEMVNAEQPAPELTGQAFASPHPRVPVPLPNKFSGDDGDVNLFLRNLRRYFDASGLDRLTKMTHLVPCKTAISSAEIADVFLREVFAKHGCPKDFVSDRDPRFTSDFFRDVCKQLQIKQNITFHPQTDGQTERMNRTVEDMLRAFVHPS